MRHRSGRARFVKRVAYLTGRSYRGTPLENETPALERPSFAMIRSAGAGRGIAFEVRHWDDAALPVQGFDAALIRSCWDYTKRADEFLATLRAHEAAGLRLFNRADVDDAVQDSRLAALIRQRGVGVVAGIQRGAAGQRSAGGSESAAVLQGAQPWVERRGQRADEVPVDAVRQARTVPDTDQARAAVDGGRCDDVVGEAVGVAGDD